MHLVNITSRVVGWLRQFRRKHKNRDAFPPPLPRIIEHSILLLGADEDVPAILHFEPADRQCGIVLNYRYKTVQASAPDFFETFCRVRQQLEQEGLMAACYGASLNAYPSGMGRDMGSGLHVYRMTIGKHVRQADLAYIFDSGGDVSPATVAEQRRFFEEWSNSEKSW
jgi:hypothetical protein